MTTFPPGLTPLPIWTLYVYEGTVTGVGCRTYGFTDPTAANAYGEKLKAQKPTEATTFGFMVLPLEAPGE